jgi:hypothetical protein
MPWATVMSGSTRLAAARPSSTAVAAQQRAPGVGRAVRVVEQAAPQPVGVAVLRPVGGGGLRQLAVGVQVAVAAATGVLAAAEGQRLAQLHAERATDRRAPAVPGEQRGVAREQEALAAGPQPEQHAVVPVGAQEVAVAVPGEAAGVLGDPGQLGGVRGPGPLQVPHRRLVVRQTLVLRPVLGGDGGPVGGLPRRAQHLGVDAFGVHVDADRPVHLPDRLEHGAPEGGPAVLVHTALVVHPEGDTGDAGAVLQQQPQRPGRVGGGVLLGQAQHRVPQVRAVGGLRPDRVVPQAELEVDAAAGRLVAGEPQRREVGVALRRGQALDADVPAGHVEQERVGEAEVVVPHIVVVGVVVLHAERQVQPVDAVGGQLVQVAAPEVAVAQPGRVEHVAAEGPQHAAQRGGRPLHGGRHRLQLALRVGRETQPVGQVQQAVGGAAGVGAGDPDAVPAGAQRERLAARGRPGTGHLDGPGRAGAEALGRHRAQHAGGPPDRWRGGEGFGELDREPRGGRMRHVTSQRKFPHYGS